MTGKSYSLLFNDRKELFTNQQCDRGTKQKKLINDRGDLPNDQ